MNTNRTFRTIVVLFVIAVLASMLSACSGNAAQDLVDLYASANSDGSAPASHSTVQYNPRNTCDLSSGIQLLSQIDADLEAVGENVTQLDITTDQWLDSRMAQFSCITATEQK